MTQSGHRSMSAFGLFEVDFNLFDLAVEAGTVADRNSRAKLLEPRSTPTSKVSLAVKAAGTVRFTVVRATSRPSSVRTTSAGARASRCVCVDHDPVLAGRDFAVVRAWCARSASCCIRRRARPYPCRRKARRPRRQARRAPRWRSRRSRRRSSPWSTRRPTPGAVNSGHPAQCRVEVQLV